MGYEFDDNGKYVGWSDLFDYSTIDTIKASEALPIPEGIAYEKRDGGFDISKQLLKIASKDNKADRIREEAELLIDLQEQKVLPKKGGKVTYVTWDSTISDEIAKPILEDLNLHSLSRISPEILLKCLKNKVSSSITNIIQNLRNMDLAYSPIAMNDLRKAADNSPKGAKSDKMTLLNPLTKFVMLEQNMVGKGVISITAVGEKVFFNLSHYFNEGIKRNDPNWLKNLLFSHTFSRILGLSKGNPVSVTKTTLANINFENFEEIRLKFAKYNDLDKQLRAAFMVTNVDIENKTQNWLKYHDALVEAIRALLDSDVYADDLISQLLSAATDNAKELILARINADTSLARCYLYLIMLGFDINDIVKFMTSPVASLVSELSTSNMFDEYMYNVSVNEAINILSGKFPLSKFMVGYVGNKLDAEGKQLTPYKYTLNRLIKKLQPVLLNLGYTMTDKKGNQVPIVYRNLNNILHDYYVERLKGRINEPLESFFESISAGTAINHNIYALCDFIDGIISKVKSSGNSEFWQDLEEFSKVYEYATETSTFGSTFLGFNLGIPTSKEELLAKVTQILKAMFDREKAFGISAKTTSVRKDMVMAIMNHNPFLEEEYITKVLLKAIDENLVGNFSFLKWLNDDSGQYRKLVSDYYNLIKGTWNIFDAIDKLPHFESIFLTLKSVLVTDLAVFKKSLIVNTIIKDAFDKSFAIDKDTISGVLKYTDKLLILRYLKDKNIKLPITKEEEPLTMFKYNWDSFDFDSQATSLSIVSVEQRGVFKKFIEEVLYPALKKGQYNDIDKKTGQLVIRHIDKNNLFILNLVFDLSRDGLQYLKLDIDMLDTNATLSNETKYQRCLSDFLKLKDCEFGDSTLADYIMLYNLIVNKNAFGSDRLTSLFVPFIGGVIKEDSLIKDYMNSTGILDFSDLDEDNIMDALKSWGYNKDDVYFEIAPIIGEAQEPTCNAPMVKEYDPKDGKLIVKKRNYATRGYGPAMDVIASSTTIGSEHSRENTLQRLLNYLDYGTLVTPFASKQGSLSTNLDSSNPELLASALRYYSLLGIIEIYAINC